MLASNGATARKTDCLPLSGNCLRRALTPGGRCFSWAATAARIVVAVRFAAVRAAFRVVAGLVVRGQRPPAQAFADPPTSKKSRIKFAKRCIKIANHVSNLQKGVSKLQNVCCARTHVDAHARALNKYGLPKGKPHKLMSNNNGVKTTL